MTYVFCESYTPLFLALSFLDGGQSVCVITNSPPVLEACQCLDLPVIPIESVPSTEAPGRSSVKADLSLRCLERWIREHTIPGSALYFSHTQFSTTAFALAKTWARTGPVWLWEVEQPHPRMSVGRLDASALRAHVRRTRARFLSGLYPLEIRTAAGIPLLAAGPDFLNRYGILRMPDAPELTAVQVEVAKHHFVTQTPVTNLLCTQPLPKGYPMVADELERLYRWMSRYDFALKSHPRASHDPSAFGGYATYPSHIPAELLLGNVSNAVVALYSSVLRTAAALPSLKAVSLLDLVRWTRTDAKEAQKAHMQRESGGAIHFPRSFEELDGLLTR